MSRVWRGRAAASAGAGKRPLPSRAALRLVGADVYPDWEAVYRDNVERVYGLMFAKVGNRADAEDLTAEVFLAALGPMRITASVGEVRAYLTATARTVLAGYWRRYYGREITVVAEVLEAAAGAEPAPAGTADADHTDDHHTDDGGAGRDGGPGGDGEAVPAGTGRDRRRGTDGGDSTGTAAAMLAGLPERYRQVLRLRFLEGFSVRETADTMGISQGNAKVLQHRALRRAAQLIEEAP